MDVTKLRQAGTEFIFTFAAFFGMSFFVWVSGWTALPNLDAAEAAVRAAVLSGSTGAAKAVLWYFTGTTAVPDDYEGDEHVHPEHD